MRGFSPFVAGLHLLPLGLAQLVAAPISRTARVVVRDAQAAGARRDGTRSGRDPAALRRRDDATWFLVVTYLLLGAGLGLINPPLTNTAVSGMPRNRSGAAAGVASTSRQTGVSLGVALAGTLTGASASASAGAGFVPATHALWFVLSASRP